MLKSKLKGKGRKILEDGFNYPEQLSSLGYNTEEITNFLKEYHYNIYKISEKESKLIPVLQILGDKVGYYLFTAEKFETQLKERKE